MTLSDIELARRLEYGGMQGMIRYARTARKLGYKGATSEKVGGGAAIYVGPENLLNGAYAQGLEGPLGEQDLDELESFFFSRGEIAQVNVCPLADISLVRGLARRLFVAVHFENVLVRELSPDEELDGPGRGVTVEIVEGKEARSEWGRVMACGFEAPEPPTEEHYAVAEVIAQAEGSVLFLGRMDGEPAGTGELFLHERVGYLNGDATLPQYRQLGVQNALQRARLAYAAAHHCELAMTEATPGSASQRNMERNGFRVAYTRTVLGKRP